MKLVFQAFLQPFLQPSRGEKADASVSSLPERLAISLLSETFQARRKEKKIFVPVRGNRWRPDSVILLLVDGFILPPNDGQRGLGIGRGRSGSLKERVRRKSRGVVDRSNGVSSAFFPRYAAYRNLMIGESDWNSWKYSDSLIKYFIETKCNKIRLNPYLELIFCETGKISHRAIFLLYTYRFILFSFDDLFLDYF